MEMTDETLRRIAANIVTLTHQIQALEIILIERLKVDPQLVNKLMNEIHDPQHQEQYQSWCNQVFEQLKGDSEPKP